MMMMMMMDNASGVAAGLVRAGEGRSIWVVGDTYTFKATTESTGGALALMEASIPPGSGPPPHVHANEDEAFYLLAGVLDISAGEETFAARAGDFVFLPRGTPHCFTNPGVDAARALILSMPAGLDRFFDEVGSTARPGEQAPPLSADEFARLIEVTPKYGLRIQLPNSAPTP
jgi:quercetin dioxygenase-like cupin family protein